MYVRTLSLYTIFPSKFETLFNETHKSGEERTKYLFGRFENAIRKWKSKKLIVTLKERESSRFVEQILSHHFLVAVFNRVVSVVASPKAAATAVSHFSDRVRIGDEGRQHLKGHDKGRVPGEHHGHHHHLVVIVAFPRRPTRRRVQDEPHKVKPRALFVYAIN